MNDLPAPDFRQDIDRDFARNAYNAISWRPDLRGDQAIEEYQAMLEADYTELRAVFDIEKALDQFDAEFDQYRQGVKQRFTAYLSAKSRCLSSAVVGPANFPVRRAEKALKAEDSRFAELLDFRKRAKKAILKKLQPYGDGSRIMSNDPEAVRKLKDKLADLQRSQEAMKEANAVIRNKKLDADGKRAKLAEMGFPNAAELLKPDFMGRVGFPPYALQNNSANMKRVQARIDELEAAQTRPALEAENNGIRLFEDEGRVQIQFPGKPSEADRKALKSNGFKWSPSRGTWVRQATGNARAAAQMLFNSLGD